MNEQPKRGDFVTFGIKDVPPDQGTRQGIFVGDGTILGETGQVYALGEVYVIVPDKNLWGTTKEFVNSWRKENL